MFMFFGVWMVQFDEGNLGHYETSALAEKRPTFKSTVTSLLAIQGTFHIAISFNIAGEFKKRFYTQRYFMGSIILYSLIQIYLIFNSRNWIKPLDDYLMDQL